MGYCEILQLLVARVSVSSLSFSPIALALATIKTLLKSPQDPDKRPAAGLETQFQRHSSATDTKTEQA